MGNMADQSTVDFGQPNAEFSQKIASGQLLFLALYDWLNNFCSFSGLFYGSCHQFHR